MQFEKYNNWQPLSSTLVFSNCWLSAHISLALSICTQLLWPPHTTRQLIVMIRYCFHLQIFITHTAKTSSPRCYTLFHSCLIKEASHKQITINLLAAVPWLPLASLLLFFMKKTIANKLAFNSLPVLISLELSVTVCTRSTCGYGWWKEKLVKTYSITCRNLEVCSCRQNFQYYAISCVVIVKCFENNQTPKLKL